MSAGDDPTPIDHLVAELRAKVAERRKAGHYPDHLEHELADHFRRIAAHRHVADLGSLRSGLETLQVRGAFGTDRIALDATTPGVSKVHRAVARVTHRQVQGVLEQVQEFADVVRELFEKVVAALEDPNAHVHADVVGHVDAILERLAAFERGPGDTDAATADLRRRVEALEAAEEARRFRPTFTSDAFERAFRGSEDELLARYRDLASHFEGRGPVLDLGCGRGEFLELLRDVGVEATGVELDPDLVADGRARGLSVDHGDAIAHLAAAVDRSLGGISMIQVIEHLTPQAALEVVTIARHKLREDGVMVVETVNPQSLYTFARSFYLDPTHTTPVHPAYLTFLFREAGWSDVEIEWRSDPPADERLADDPSASEVGRANIERLNSLLFAPQDYAVIAKP